MKIPFLGEVPIFTEIREGGDRGVPVVVSSPDKPAGQAFPKHRQKPAGQSWANTIMLKPARFSQDRWSPVYATCFLIVIPASRRSVRTPNRITYGG